ncbi:MAG TPA: TlpA disulfide reductase family protein [Acidimicrobiales bacterium]|nr:TlpA disulfide reductase family protein [Acidimicrobiales bacterium]
MASGPADPPAQGDGATSPDATGDPTPGDGGIPPVVAGDPSPGDGGPTAATNRGGPDGTAPERGPGTGRPPRRSLLDARTLMVCALVALVAAVLAGLVVSTLTGDDDGEQPEAGLLTEAEVVPDIALDRLAGEGRASLADYQGQPLVVNFWGSWCAPCVEEMPDLQRVHTSLGDDVSFVGVNIRDQDPQDARDLARQTGVTYDLLVDAEGALTRALGIVTAPVTLLVLPDGTIAEVIQRTISAERLCEKLNQTVYAGGLEECG